MKSQQHYTRSFSCEFFPAKTEAGADNLRNASLALKKEMNPSYFSVTYGAGGSDQDKTFSTVDMIKQASGINVAPHLTCIGSKKNEISKILEDYKAKGINRIVALRGDIPKGMDNPGELNYANELISFIRETTGEHFTIEVAAYPEFHPQASNATDDLKNFRQKVMAGANSAITQYFYNADAYFRFIDDCEKMAIDIPVIPGIMPITNYTSLARFSAMCGAEIPLWLSKRLLAFGDDTDAIKDYGTEIVTDMCQRLLDAGAPGLHFYTLNQSEASLRIWKNLTL
ncbi:MAG: methylenetetrahydrofolate reductase [NAD(P)H] [Gammaproteobacteria bacterium]|nr:methylenetetrahydrofolate reductase [NAD(P)H] [Gammaproteobacteria bacterium]